MQLTLDVLLQEVKSIKEIGEVQCALLSEPDCPEELAITLKELVGELRGIREALTEGLGLWRTYG